MATDKPADGELDVYGLTHTGKVRPANQDHFLIGALRRDLAVYQTSLPPEDLAGSGERLAFLAMVADGVGGGPLGEEASRIALETIAEYVSHCSRCYYAIGATDHDTLATALADAAMESHAEIVRRAEADPSRQGMATTLTLWIGVWPNAYLLQVGDSRCYMLRGETLTQLSRDQTMAQALVDEGVMTPAKASETRWAHILSSAIGGRETLPVVTRFRQERGNVGLLCSDGLTRHVSDEKIRERLLGMTSAQQACEALLQDALEGGGTDNITIVIGRAVTGAPGSPS